jgi:hypothetical protein
MLSPSRRDGFHEEISRPWVETHGYQSCRRYATPASPRKGADIMWVSTSGRARVRHHWLAQPHAAAFPGHCRSPYTAVRVKSKGVIHPRAGVSGRARAAELRCILAHGLGRGYAMSSSFALRSSAVPYAAPPGRTRGGIRYPHGQARGLPYIAPAGALGTIQPYCMSLDR